MKLTSTITLAELSKEEQKHLLALFANEDKELSNKRANYSITPQEESLIFAIKASDAVALRAMLTGISKTLATHHKMKELLDND